MLKNPIVLVGIALLVAAAVWLAATGLGGDRSTELQPLKPPAGESLRRQGTPPKPALADPAAALAVLERAPALPKGDAVLRDLLKAALAAGEKPSFRASVDAPFDDNAAQQVKDELREWLDRKMAGLGFGDAASKPTLMWIAHVDPLGEGRYAIQLTLRAGGAPRLEEKLELPAAWTADRLDTALGASFGPVPAAPAQEKTP